MEIIEELKHLNDLLEAFLLDAGVLAPIFSTLLVFLEGIFAFLPLFIFITVNVLTLGPILGGIVSWIFTVLGCFTTFYLCRKGFSGLFERKLGNKEKIKHFMDVVSNLNFCKLVLIISIPFAHSFFINVGASLCKINTKKYFYALLVGKIFVVIFCGYIGSNLVECLTNPLAFIKVVALLVAAYVLGRIVNKKFNLDERY